MVFQSITVLLSVAELSHHLFSLIHSAVHA